MLYFLFDLFSQLFLGFFDGGLLAGLFFLAAALYSFLFRSKKNLLNISTQTLSNVVWIRTTI